MVLIAYSEALIKHNSVHRDSPPGVTPKLEQKSALYIADHHVYLFIVYYMFIVYCYMFIVDVQQLLPQQATLSRVHNAVKAKNPIKPNISTLFDNMSVIHRSSLILRMTDMFVTSKAFNKHARSKSSIIECCLR